MARAHYFRRKSLRCLGSHRTLLDAVAKRKISTPDGYQTPIAQIYVVLKYTVYLLIYQGFPKRKNVGISNSDIY
jgi:hypothetical protein